MFGIIVLYFILHPHIESLANKIYENAQSFAMFLGDPLIVHTTVIGSVLHFSRYEGLT